MKDLPTFPFAAAQIYNWKEARTVVVHVHIWCMWAEGLHILFLRFLQLIKRLSNPI